MEQYMVDNVLWNKADTIEKCLRRIDEEYAGKPENLRNNQTKQDSIILNLRRSCQATIDMAMRVIRLKRLGLPKESREAFDLLTQSGLISDALCRKMHGLIGFRNTAFTITRSLI